MIGPLFTCFIIGFFFGCGLGASIGVSMQSKRALYRSLNNAD